MPLDAPSQALVNAASCDSCKIPSGLIYYAVLAELIHVANDDPMPTDSATLITESSCLFSCVPAGLLPYVMLQAVRGISGGGGGPAFNNKFGVGSPVGVVTPDYVGQYYLDTTDPYDTWFSTGLTNADWVMNTGGITSGGGGGGGVSDPTQTVGIVDPEGAITAEPGSTYLNTDNSTFWVKASGSGDTGWVQIV